MDFLCILFLPLHFSFLTPLSPPSLLTIGLIIAKLHQDNRSVESRAAAAEAGWENPSCLLQPVRLPADSAHISVIILSIQQRRKERDD